MVYQCSCRYFINISSFNSLRTTVYRKPTRLLQPNIIHGRPRAIRTLTKRARPFYCTKDSLSNENKYVDPLFFRKATTTTTLEKTDKDLLSPLLVRVFDRTNHLFICTTLCRLKNYFLSYYVSHIYSVKPICQDNTKIDSQQEFHIGLGN